MAEWERFWRDSSAEASFAGTDGTHPAFVQYWSKCFSALDLASGGQRCIDMATGSGTVIQCAHEYFGDKLPLYCGLDFSAAAIDRLTARIPKTSGIVADAAAAPFDSYSFELVTSQFGVEYAGIAGILEAARLVAVGGHLAIVLHCRPGAVYDECSTSLRAIDKLRHARFFPLAVELFNAAFTTLRSGEQRPYQRAVRKFKPALRVLERQLSKYGEGVASGFALRLRNDIERIGPRVQHYDPKEVLGWLKSLDEEMMWYRSRMQSMTRATISRKTLDQIEKRLAKSGFSITEVSQICDQSSKTPLAWSLQAQRAGLERGPL